MRSLRIGIGKLNVDKTLVVTRASPTPGIFLVDKAYGAVDESKAKFEQNVRQLMLLTSNYSAPNV